MTQAPYRAPNGQFARKPLAWWQKVAVRLLARLVR